MTMKLLIFLSLMAEIYGLGSLKSFCYYDSSSSKREGDAALTNDYLELALPYCSHLVYGYLGIKPDSFEVHSLNEDVDIESNQFAKVAAFKKKYPHLKVLLSIGGDKDVDPDHANKYIELLEAGHEKQTAFINSINSMVNSYGFDGIDLAYQFPKTKPRKVHTTSEALWKGVKKLFTGDFVVDANATQHKNQFTILVQELRKALEPKSLLLMVTALPNVDPSWYFDVRAVSSVVDYVNLATFDSVTPERNPERAHKIGTLDLDLYFSPNQAYLQRSFAHALVSYWRRQHCPSDKIILGIATYGRAWKLSASSGSVYDPVVYKKGAADPGPISKVAGLLSYPEILSELNQTDYPLRTVDDPSQRYALSAFRPADDKGHHGIWISFENAQTAIHKALYVRRNKLGGLSLFDLSYDDFRGLFGFKFPILKFVVIMALDTKS